MYYTDTISPISTQRMNYSDFHKNRVRYTINTTNKSKSKIILFIYLNCGINNKNN